MKIKKKHVLELLLFLIFALKNSTKIFYAYKISRIVVVVRAKI